MLDLLIIGAGPCGLSAAAAAQAAGLSCRVWERGGIVQSVADFPTYMTFFSTPELLEIAGVPFICPGEKPSRRDALHYYLAVAGRLDLPADTFREARRVIPEDGSFRVEGMARGTAVVEHARRVVVATGYYAWPNLLGIPGEERPQVSHYYREGHPYHGCDVLVVGGNNSAVEAAMDLCRHGARVTLVHRGAGLGAKIKPWVLPDIQAHLAKGQINSRFQSRLVRIGPRTATLASPAGEEDLPCDFVFALTGYRPDLSLLAAAGVEVAEATGAPRHDPETLETNVPGLYIAGVLAAGRDANRIFIENGRAHGPAIVAAILEETRRGV